MSKDSPNAGGLPVPNANLVSKQQKLSCAAALLPLTLLLPMMLLGMHPRHLPPEQTRTTERTAERAEHIRLLRQELAVTTVRAAYWRAAAHRDGGDAHAALRARRWSRKIAWQTKRLADLRP